MKRWQNFRATMQTMLAKEKKKKPFDAGKGLAESLPNGRKTNPKSK
jgi:hypothetical protein